MSKKDDIYQCIMEEVGKINFEILKKSGCTEKKAIFSLMVKSPKK